VRRTSGAGGAAGRIGGLRGGEQGDRTPRSAHRQLVLVVASVLADALPLTDAPMSPRQGTGAMHWPSVG
jgi:hypothetical protein